MQRRKATLVAAVVALGIALAAASSAVAVSSGDTIRFLVADSISVLPGEDRIIFTGGEPVPALTQNCGSPGDFWVVQIVRIRPGGPAAPASALVNAPVPDPGTRVREFVQSGECFDFGVHYYIFEGVPE